MNISTKKTIIATTLISAVLLMSTAQAGRVGDLQDYAPDPSTQLLEEVKIKDISR